MIPFASPKASYLAHQSAIDAAIERTLESGHYVLGHEVEMFEAEFAAYCQADHCVGVASGTDAICLALQACGLGAGDEVITTAHTASCSVAAIELAGATPMLADIDPNTYQIDMAQVAERVTPRTRALLLVHLYGRPAALDGAQQLCQRHGLQLVEDCAQAAGARANGRRVGSIGSISAFSFYPTKNLGALGDGGAVVTSSQELAERVRVLRNYGWRERYVSERPGTNSRLDELQAAVLRVKLRHLDADNARRRTLASQYTNALQGLPLVVPETGTDLEQVWHLYVMRTAVRDRLRAFLETHGVATGIHYPVPVHLQPAYAGRLGRPGDFPHAEAATREILSLPLYPEMSEHDVDTVCAAVAGFFRQAES